MFLTESLDEIEKNQALRSNIRVKDVLEGSIVSGPEEDLPPRLGKGGGYGGGGPDLFDDDPNIEYITDPDEIYELDAKIAKLQGEHLVPVTEDILKTSLLV